MSIKELEQRPLDKVDIKILYEKIKTMDTIFKVQGDINDNLGERIELIETAIVVIMDMQKDMILKMTGADTIEELLEEKK